MRFVSESDECWRKPPPKEQKDEADFFSPTRLLLLLDVDMLMQLLPDDTVSTTFLATDAAMVANTLLDKISENVNGFLLPRWFS